MRYYFKFIIACTVLLFTFAACNNDSDTPSPKEKKILVTKMEVTPIYILEGMEEYLHVAAHDITEMKYDAQGRLIEWWSNGEYAGGYTYTDGKILATDIPDEGSFEHILSPSGQVIETHYADGTSDKLSYDDAGRCIAINENVDSSNRWNHTLFHWTDTDMTCAEYLVPEDPSEIRVSYTDIPKKGNAPYLRALQLFTGGYWQNLEVSGHLNISSDKYLPEKGIVNWSSDGYVQIYEATYDLNADGTVKTMHITLNDGYPDSEDDMRLVYEGEVTFSYLEL